MNKDNKLMTTKTIDANKLNADFIKFENLHRGDDYYATSSIDELDLPCILRKSVVDELDSTYRINTIKRCNAVAEHGWWTNAALTFKMQPESQDLRSPERGKSDDGEKIMSVFAEWDIKSRQHPVEIVAQNSERIMLENEHGRIVVSKRFFQIVRKFADGDVVQLSCDSDFACLRIGNADGNMVALIMSITDDGNPLWKKTTIQNEKPSLDNAFAESQSVTAKFSKPYTENRDRFCSVYFTSDNATTLKFEAYRMGTFGVWKLQHFKTKGIEFDNLRQLKKFATKMAEFMSVNENGFVEFNIR